jgi:AcrR family transcriptional regulator
VSPRPRRPDAEANRARLLEVAAPTFRTDGTRVPMSTIARRAGVGVGTLYRHFPDREELLAGLEQHSYALTLELAEAAAARHESGADSLRFYLETVIASRDRLFLPLHGGPMSGDARSVGLRRAIGGCVARILARGQADGSIREDATPMDVIIGGTFLCMPLPNARDWDAIAVRQLEIFLAGMAAPDRR